MRTIGMMSIGLSILSLVAAASHAQGRRHPAFTLKSATIDLPADDAGFPGADAEVMTANCTACHSASMVLTQPKLTGEQWIATIAKMRTVYKAPIADADVPNILAYLNATSARTPAR